MFGFIVSHFNNGPVASCADVIESTKYGLFSGNGVGEHHQNSPEQPFAKHPLLRHCCARLC